MLKALLIDDEERATDALRLMIEKFIPEIGQVQVCNDARLAGTMIHTFQPGLVFLDIRMPHQSGFDILKNIPVKNFKVIFTTAYNEYTIQAIRFSAFDYLLKPIDVEELIDSVKRYIQSNKGYMQQQELLNNIMYNMQAGGSHSFRLALPGREGVYFYLPKEIIRCEAIGNYTKFYITGNKQYVIAKTLGEYEELLMAYPFIRTHKSHLVNKDFISFIDQEGFVILKDSSKVEISRRRRKEVMDKLRSE